MACINYCESELLPYEVVGCEGYENGGIEDAVLFKCGSEPTDSTDGVEIAAIIAAGNAVLIRGLKIGLPAASPITQDAPTSCGVPITTNYDRTATLFDANMNIVNNAFWNSANNQKFGAALFSNCEAGDSFYVDPPSGISVQISPIVTDTNTEYRRYEGQLAWRDKEMPVLQDTPPGVFT
jgi:hypothetical protein